MSSSASHAPPLSPTAHVAFGTGARRRRFSVGGDGAWVAAGAGVSEDSAQATRRVAGGAEGHSFPARTLWDCSGCNSTLRRPGPWAPAVTAASLWGRPPCHCRVALLCWSFLRTGLHKGPASLPSGHRARGSAHFRFL